MVRRLADGTLFVGEVTEEVKEEESEILGDQFLTEEPAEDIPEEPIAETPAEKKPVKKPTTAAKRKSSGKTKRK